MSSADVGPGLRPRDGADPTEPSERTGSVLDKESVLKSDSAEGMEGSGSLILIGLMGS